MTRSLIAIPAYNEALCLPDIERRLRVVHHARGRQKVDVLLVNDGSSDATGSVADEYGWKSIHHDTRRGYGASLTSAIEFARAESYDYILTMDADGQHPPELLLAFLEAQHQADVISGSRYLPESPRIHEPLAPHLNGYFTRIINDLFHLGITDVGCGMKSINIASLAGMAFTETGYLFPVEFWVRLAQRKCSIRELPVPMIYLDRTKTLDRKFGSVEALIDEAIFVILSSLTPSRPRYDASVDCWADLAAAARQFGPVSDAVEQLLRLLASAEQNSFPVSRAQRSILALADTMPAG
jgi:glycosyltransferase involved in cell wall biosynthesis